MGLNDITIEGLSPVQMEIADILWKFDTLDQIDSWIAKIPTRRGRIEARVVQNMMVAAVLDQQDPDVEEAGHYLRAIQGR
jgi:hypothetical protein